MSSALRTGKFVYVCEFDRRNSDDDKLRNTVTALYGKSLRGIGVDKYHLDFSAVTAVNESRSVDYRDAVLRS